MKSYKRYPVGEVRPTQLLLTYGVGSIIDLPHISTLIMGLDDWDTADALEIHEERLLLAVQSALGQQVKQLLSPPSSPANVANPFDSRARTGVPVVAFPRWMVCPRCHLLAPVDAGYFELKTHPFQPDRTRYIHQNCVKQPTVLPSRFLIACEGGHLDDFPWVHFVHRGKSCKALLRMFEVGVSGEPSDIYRNPPLSALSFSYGGEKRRSLFGAGEPPPSDDEGRASSYLLKILIKCIRIDT